MAIALLNHMQNISILLSLSGPCSLEMRGDFFASLGLKSPLPLFSFSDPGFFFPIKWFFPQRYGFSFVFFVFLSSICCDG